MTDDYLIERGYKKYEPTRFDNESVVARFQKRFDDDFVKKGCGKVEGERFAQDIDKTVWLPTTSCGF